jgi:hypothetical protein
MNYITLRQVIQSYAENTEALFVANIPVFIQQAEQRIYNTVQIPVLRKNVTGNVTVSNPYLSCPNDFLAVYSLAVISNTGAYQYLIDKDVSFIREAYPSPTDISVPKYYSIFGSQLSYQNEISLLLAPTPDANYNVELHYFYYPVTIVQGIIDQSTISLAGAGYTNGAYYNVSLTGGNGFYATANIIVSAGIVTSAVLVNAGSLYTVGDVLSVSSSALGTGGSGFTLTVLSVSNAAGTSWLGDNYDPVLFYGAMREAMIFMKGEADMVGYYEQKYQEAIGQLKRLGDGLERGDSYRNNQIKIPYSSL